MNKQQRLWILTAFGLMIFFVGVAGMVRAHNHKPNAAASNSGNTSLPPSVTRPTQTQSSAPKVESTSSTLVSGSASSIVTVRSSAGLGKYLADPDGRALYIYNKDLPDQSNCAGSCAQTWPPYSTSKLPHLPINISDIKRADGRIQYTWKGLPLYYFANEKPAVVSGNGVAGFSVAKP